MEREARRKKIKSQEMDRMALITGRILDPNTAKSCDDLPKHSRSSSEPPPPQLFLDRPHGGDDDDEAFSHSKSRASSALVASRDAKLPRKPLMEYHLSSISPRDINVSIISSEKTRAVCSLVIAVLVVLSHIDLPHKVVKSKSLIAYRPLYAVLVSDLLIVAATLALLSQGRESEKEVKLVEDVNWDGAVKVLEWGLILHQTVRAIFIDCTLYLAIVICGLSLMH